MSDGESATSMCGCVIFKTLIGAMCDQEYDPDSLLKSPTVCKKCLEETWHERYLYMVRESEEEYHWQPRMVEQDGK